MKFSPTILFYGCITVATCYPECKWTGCEGILMAGNGICSSYGYGLYTGKTRKGDCNWDAEQVLCCSETPPVACEWSSCEGFLKNGNDICGRDVNGFYTGRKSKSDCKWDSARVECCDLAPMSSGCEWVQGCYLKSYRFRETKCAINFGAEYMPTRTLRCSHLLGVTYECCPSALEQEENLELNDTH